MVEYFSLIIITGQRHGLTPEQGVQVRYLIISLPPLHQEVIWINLDLFLKVGKKEFIQMAEYSSSITVCLHISLVMRVIIILSSVIHCFLSFADTRTTQWEDPRMSNPQIAGPVSTIYEYVCLYIKVKSTLIIISLLQAVPYSRDYKRKYEYLKSQLRKPVSMR